MLDLLQQTSIQVVSIVGTIFISTLIGTDKNHAHHPSPANPNLGNSPSLWRSLSRCSFEGRLQATTTAKVSWKFWNWNLRDGIRILVPFQRTSIRMVPIVGTILISNLSHCLAANPNLEFWSLEARGRILVPFGRTSIQMAFSQEAICPRGSEPENFDSLGGYMDYLPPTPSQAKDQILALAPARGGATEDTRRLRCELVGRRPTGSPSSPDPREVNPLLVQWGHRGNTKASHCEDEDKGRPIGSPPWIGDCPPTPIGSRPCDSLHHLVLWGDRAGTNASHCEGGILGGWLPIGWLPREWTHDWSFPPAPSPFLPSFPPF